MASQQTCFRIQTTPLNTDISTKLRYFSQLCDLFNERDIITGIPLDTSVNVDGRGKCKCFKIRTGSLTNMGWRENLFVLLFLSVTVRDVFTEECKDEKCASQMSNNGKSPIYCLSYQINYENTHSSLS